MSFTDNFSGFFSPVDLGGMGQKVHTIRRFVPSKSRFSKCIAIPLLNMTSLSRIQIGAFIPSRLTVLCFYPCVALPFNWMVCRSVCFYYAQSSAVKMVFNETLCVASFVYSTYTNKHVIYAFSDVISLSSYILPCDL